MKILSQHIKTGQFKPVYLICGDEDYLRKRSSAMVSCSINCFISSGEKDVLGACAVTTASASVETSSCETDSLTVPEMSEPVSVEESFTGASFN